MTDALLSQEFQVGQKLIYFGRVHEISRIDQKKDQPIKLVMKPLFKMHAEDTLICKIPVDQMSLTKVRDPLSKKLLKDMFELIGSSKVKIADIDKEKVDTAMYSDGIATKAKLFKGLWVEKNDPEGKFSFSKKKLLADLMRCLAEEIALVFNTDLDDGEQRLVNAVAV